MLSPNTAFHKKCFYLSDDDSTETWEGAQEACKKKYPKSELASISGPIEQGETSSYYTLA